MLETSDRNTPTLERWNKRKYTHASLVLSAIMRKYKIPSTYNGCH